ncbi:MAG: hypothetical protein KDK99_11340 [Verrucomicrobiales bacterium]|nr:hypothetical protein [Verrucomicrobiales bacterium]
MRFLPLLLLSCALIASAAELPFVDDFSDSQLQTRRAVRGAWTFKDGVASVTQDDELYAKFKNHGPIIFYDLTYTDAVIEFDFRPQEAQTVVFTANGADGHVFRTISSARGTDLRAFPPGADEHSVSLLRLEHPLAQGQWTHMKVVLQGDSATVTLGDAAPAVVHHPSLKRAKENASIGFSFGQLSVRHFTAQPISE